MVVAQIFLQIIISRILIINNFDIIVDIIILVLLQTKLFIKWIIYILANINRHVMISQLLYILIFVTTLLVFTCNRTNFLSLYFNVVLMIKIHFIYLSSSLFPFFFCLFRFRLININFLVIIIDLWCIFFMKIIRAIAVWNELIIVILAENIFAINNNQFVITHLKLVLNRMWNFWIVMSIQIENIRSSYFISF